MSLESFCVIVIDLTPVIIRDVVQLGAGDEKSRQQRLPSDTDTDERELLLTLLPESPQFEPELPTTTRRDLPASIGRSGLLSQRVQLAPKRRACVVLLVTCCPTMGNHETRSTFAHDTMSDRAAGEKALTRSTNWFKMIESRWSGGVLVRAAVEATSW